MCSTARLCSNVGYAFVHMEKKEEALAAIDALNGTMYKGRQLAVELSKAQPLINQLVTGNSTGVVAGGDEGSMFSILCLHRVISRGPFVSLYLSCYPLPFLAGGLLPRPPPSLEHHQSQAAVLAAAAAAAAGLPIQVSFVICSLSRTTSVLSENRDVG